MSGLDLERYIELYRRSVTDAALFIVKNPADAEDIAQEVFLKLYTYTGSFNDDDHVRAWLLRCAVNRALNLVKSGWHRHSLPLEAAGDEAGETQERNSDVKTAMMSLPPKLRAALYMHYYEGYTAEETAKLLGLSTAAVKARLKRGRDRLRTLLENEERS
ncbi:MAG: RNA polymerase sigma factor [Ruminiclostridium sp.]|nr:RNA polymerase sigma factor [Ruminiclostridium sp.]